MFGIGVPELIIILIIGLVLFGPGKLPEVGRAVGKSINELKKATAGITENPQQTPPTVNKSETASAAVQKQQPGTTNPEGTKEETKIVDK
ncbi:twin-arginine translocase TatA/TatE family subunit [Pectinatus frisingensis]|jgi:sec-independent protein translocase protein TatA|uniref:twin-arginine translocase TatA/TatE family subunit n=1 Tax=Pectinatus frisingensis TaxID=865 RepID=UPI0018C7947F|nr:twin-arginine translocase TatA/TatE family subunit [Pectinatus frisingensis]